MISCYFRVLENGKPNGWIGLAVALDMGDLPDAIEEFVDPWAVQIKLAYEGGYCRKLEKVDGVGMATETEISEFEPFIDEEGWFSPPWIELKKIGLA